MSTDTPSHTLPQEDASNPTQSLLTWYRQNRRTLPWRGADPYGVWISEIMLQQTQVATVIPYYLRFMQRFPTVQALADAPLDDVLGHWAGLGYYARGRNLHRAAQLVCEKHAGHLPDTLEGMLSLPGVGEYTAGAVVSIAYGKPAPAVDANVIRVICRFASIHGDPAQATVKQRIKETVTDLIPPDAAGDFTQALMELGALVCMPAEPACSRCPLLQHCGAGNSSDPSALPEYPEGKGTTTAVHSCAVILDRESGRAVIVQRPLNGLWGGLWEFPRVICGQEESPAEAAIRAANGVVQGPLKPLRKVSTVKHAVTRYRITLHAYLFEATLPASSEYPDNETSAAAVSLQDLANYAFSSPQAIVRQELLAQLHQPALPQL
jgi:A/G-specific adenine glycosylase